MSTSTSTPEVETYGRTYAWSLVAVFTALSVTLNAAHAVLAMPDRSSIEQSLAALVAIVAPTSLLLATELVVRLIRDWTSRRRWLTALRGICAGTTAAIAAVAFATSFVALMDMAGRMGVSSGLTWALPAVVDAMIIIATLAVVVAEAEMMLDRADEQRSTEVSEHLDELDDELSERWPTRLSERSADHVDEQRPTAVSELDDELDEQWPTRVSEYPVEPLSTSPDQGGQVVDHLDEQRSTEVSELSNDVSELRLTGLSERPVDHLDEQPSTGVSERLVELDEHLDEQWLTEVSEQSSADLSDHPVDQLDEQWLAVAERVRTDTGITASVDDLAAVLRMDDAGASRREIAAAVGRPRSTVSGWITKAAGPELVAVSN